jgi:hypothetical protein
MLKLALLAYSFSTPIATSKVLIQQIILYGESVTINCCPVAMKHASVQRNKTYLSKGI